MTSRMPGGLARPAATDVFFEWFSELEHMGESTEFRLGRMTHDLLEPEWSFLPHHSYDGIGGLAHVLREFHATELYLPQLRSPYPSRAARWVAALRCLLQRPPSALVDWHTVEEEPALATVQAGPRPPSAFAWGLLSKRETLALRDQARARNVSLNAWLLWGLTRAMMPHLVPGPGSIEWVVPVNMRGADQALRPTENQAATIDVVFQADASAHEVSSAIARQMQRNMHWGVWQLLSLLRRARPSLVRQLSRREAHTRKHGSFSNLGILQTGPKPRLGPPEWWMAFNPVLRSRPIGAACLTYDEQLSVTLQLHPSLSIDPSVARAGVEEWLRAVLPANVQPHTAAPRSTAGTVTD